MTSKWGQKCSPLQIVEPLTEKTWGWGCVIFWWAEKQRAKWRNFFKNGEIFWMNNKAIIEFGFRRIWRILQISEDVINLGLRPLWITPSLIRRTLHILRKPNLYIIAKLFCRGRQRNAQRFITHVHSHCSAHLTFCLATLPEPHGAPSHISVESENGSFRGG